MRYLSESGLSMTQAQSLSNLFNQKAEMISNTLNSVNAFTKKFNHSGEEYTHTGGISLPSEVREMLEKKAMFHAAQAFLMEHITLKAKLITEEEIKNFRSTQEAIDIVNDYQNNIIDKPRQPVLSSVDEKWGKSKLSNEEWKEFVYHEAMAAHYGLFIHKDGKLTELRNATSKGPQFEVITIGNDTVPLRVTVNHDANNLMDLHEELSSKHRSHEQKVNYYKSKIKDIVKAENDRLHNEWLEEMKSWREKYNEVEAHNNKLLTDMNQKLSEGDSRIEKEKRDKISQLSKLRITIPETFKAIINEYLPETAK